MDNWEQYHAVKVLLPLGELVVGVGIATLICRWRRITSWYSRCVLGLASFVMVQAAVFPYWIENVERLFSVKGEGLEVAM